MSSDQSSTPAEPGIRREVWTLAGHAIDLSWPGDMDALLDAKETRRRFAQDEYMPYWAQPWPASLLLATDLLQGPPGQGRAAIELGCGVGLVSIAAALAGWSVTATDYDESAIDFARRNAERSGAVFAEARMLDYREPLPAPAYELVLGSDLLYERKKVSPVAAWIASALLPDGVALVSDPNRSAADAFTDELQGRGLRGEPRAVEMTSPAGFLIRGRIWRITH